MCQVLNVDEGVKNDANCSTSSLDGWCSPLLASCNSLLGAVFSPPPPWCCEVALAAATNCCCCINMEDCKEAIISAILLVTLGNGWTVTTLGDGCCWPLTNRGDPIDEGGGGGGKRAGDVKLSGLAVTVPVRKGEVGGGRREGESLDDCWSCCNVEMAAATVTGLCELAKVAAAIAREFDNGTVPVPSSGCSLDGTNGWILSAIGVLDIPPPAPPLVCCSFERGVSETGGGAVAAVCVKEVGVEVTVLEGPSLDTAGVGDWGIVWEIRAISIE